jgi:uncharacterized protein YabE (DUF348 family)/3D (Asp-Asp-Asp) domain-containing protein
MKRLPWLLLALALLACQPQTAANTIQIVDGNRLVRLQTESRTPADILAQAGLTLAPVDEIHLNGQTLAPESPLPTGVSITLQIRRALNLTIVTPDGQRSFQTTAATVGQALAQTGLQLYVADFIDPPIETPIQADLTVTYRPAQDLTILVDGRTIPAKSAAPTVGQALAEAGIPLVGLDQSQPVESAPLPADGQINIVRVTETVTLTEKSLPFQIEYQLSDQLDLDTQNLLQAGEPGLSVSRTRARYEDGVEISRVTEAETIVRAPQSRVVGQGTKVTVRALEGGLKYWRAVRMYATWYSPCHSGVSGCSYGTASGLPLKKGVVALVRRFYNLMVGERVYIPGYGTATIGDVGGGMPDGRLWIDLGYGENDGNHLSGWVTVYFLTPVPDNILYVME